MTQDPSGQKITIGIAGIGSVGRSLIERLAEEEKKGSPFQLVAVSSRREKPWLKNGNISFVDRPTLLAEQTNIDIIVEAMGGVQAAYELTNAALSNGKHVITANSTMMAAYGESLIKIAKVNNRYLGFEAAVLAGLPLRSFFTSLQQDLPRATVMLSNGLNLTLQRMQRMGESFEQALQVVEKDMPIDPSGKEDVYRLTLLRALLYGRWGNVAQQKSLHIEGLNPEDLALVNHLGGVVQVAGMVHAGGVALQPMVLPAEHVLSNNTSRRESMLLELPAGPVQLSAPARCGGMAVESILNDLRAAQGGRAWQPRLPSEVKTDLNTGSLFVRFNRVDQDLLRRDSRWSVMQERLDRTGNKVGATVATNLTPQQMMDALPNSMALPVWQAVGQEIQPLDTPLRLVS